MINSRFNKIILSTAGLMIISWVVLDFFYTLPAQKKLKTLMDRQMKMAAQMGYAELHKNASKKVRNYLNINAPEKLPKHPSENHFKFMQIMNTYLQEGFLEITEITLDSSIYMDNIVKSSYQCNFQGNYSNFLQFTAKIESMYLILDISEIIVKPRNLNPANPIENQFVDITMLVNLYYISRIKQKNG